MSASAQPSSTRLQLSLRWRTTLLITAAFIVVALGLGFTARTVMSRLMTNERIIVAAANIGPMADPAQWLDESGDVVPFPPFGESGEVVDAIYLDASGNEISEETFRSALRSAEIAVVDSGAAMSDVDRAIDDLLREEFDRCLATGLDPEMVERERDPECSEIFGDSSDTEAGVVVDVLVPSVSPSPDQDLLEELDVERIDGTDYVRITWERSIGTEPYTVGVVTSLRPVREAVTAFDRTMLGIGVVLTAIVAAMTWWATSLALRPVEQIRRQVERTDPATLNQHVPVSGTGDEIDRLANTMNDMLDRLHQASVDRRRFISDASHELRSPVTAMLTTIETTDDDAIAAEWPTLRRTLLDQQHRLGTLVDDLLTLSALDERGADDTRPEPVDLDELALSVAERPRPHPVAVRIEEPARVLANSKQIEHCVTNLVDNAARHAESRLWVTVGRDGAAAWLVVDDDGPGIAPEHREEIFERFFRLDQSRSRSDGGAGLGLAIARQIAEEQGATLTVNSNDQGGASFRLEFAASSVDE